MHKGVYMADISKAELKVAIADIVRRVSKRDIPRIHRDIDQEDLILVKAGAAGSNEVSIDFILSGISQRLADLIRSTATERGKVGEADVDAAMQRIVTLIRSMEKEGDLILQSTDDA